jgi:deazaflavin-dependent oxidoreductase (nitroreductase family)
MSMTDFATQSPNLPPEWFKHAFWWVHRALYLLSHGRFLWTPASKRGWGALALTTTGRKTGRDRRVIIGYLQDGPNLVSLAMNGWDEGHPSWWLNLEEHPEAVVRLVGQHPRPVYARCAVGEERERLWQRWRAVDLNLDGFAGLRSTETPVVIFEPRDGSA